MVELEVIYLEEIARERLPWHILKPSVFSIRQACLPLGVAIVLDGGFIGFTAFKSRHELAVGDKLNVEVCPHVIGKFLLELTRKETL